MQLRRPTDDSRSEPVDFEMLPLNEGRRGFWNIQRELKKRSASDDLFKLLDTTEQTKFKVERVESFENVSSRPLHVEDNNTVVILDTPVVEEKTSNWLDNAEFVIDNNNNENDQNIINHNEDDKTLNDLLEQVAELDVIYEDHHIQRNDLPTDAEMNENFDDSATYTSLQKAFKHPIEFADAPPLPPKQNHICDSTAFDLFMPPISLNPLNDDEFNCEEFEDEKMLPLPPLPPKRAKSKVIEDKENLVQNGEEFLPLGRQGSTRSLTPRPTQQIIIKSADKSPSKSACNTLPKQKKPGFFSKMFGRRKSKIDDVSDELNGNENTSMASFRAEDSHQSSPSKSPIKQKSKVGKPVGRSVSSVSGKRPHLGPDVINIPLKGDSTNSLPLHGGYESMSNLPLPAVEFYEKASTASLHPLDRKTVSALQLADVPVKDGDMSLVAIADAQSLRNLCEGEFGITLDPDVDLTEAEHYALYTTFAPHATMSEIDETSCYYSPVECGEILTPAEVAKRLADNL
jgi:c-Rel proto-oncogene protein